MKIKKLRLYLQVFECRQYNRLSDIDSWASWWTGYV